MKKFYGVIKFCLDEFIAFISLLILSLGFLVVAIIIKCTSKGPVFFRQQRVGKNKKLFGIRKFRTMRTDTPKDVPTHQLKNPEIYITKIGKFLRKTSLDELPQLIDILLGKMSFVGPRPALYNQDDLIALRDEYGVNAIRPGLTGWAQINGRDAISIEQKALLDKEYVDKYGFIMDCRCIFGSVFTVLRHKGVVEGGTGAIEESEVATTENQNENGENDA